MENIVNKFANLPRKDIPSGKKEMVWLRIQNYLRSQRAIQESKASSGFILGFRFGKIALTALTVVVSLGVVGGVAKASWESLPGETLYPVKKAAEQVEKVLATSDEAKVKVAVRHAKRRLEEVKVLVEENKGTEVVTATLEKLKTTTEQVISISVSNPELSGQAVALAEEEQSVLSQVGEKVEGETLEAVQEAINASKESLSKLKAEEEIKGEETAASEEENSTSTSTPKTASPARKAKPKVEDGVIESQIQLSGVIKGEDAENPKPEPLPEIISEPAKSP